MQPTYSTLEVARRLGVSVQSVQRWVDIGRLRAWKTPGGHRRIDAGDAEALFREFAEGRPLPVPAEAAEATAPSVLVVDDDPLDRELTVHLMRSLLPNAVVSCATNGFEALLAVGRQAYDVLITDVVMPKMDGFEMLRHLASEGPRRPRFLVATSSHAQAELRGLGTLPDGVTFIPKPLNADAIGRWLAQHFPTPATT